MPAEAAAPRVLVTGAGGPSATSFMAAVSGEPVELWPGDIDPHAPGLYLVPQERRLILPRGDAPGFVDRVLALCELHDISVVVPTVDSELVPLAERRDDFSSLGTRVLVAEAAPLGECLDKWTLMQRCAGHVTIPRCALLDGSFEPADWEPPVVVKPRRGSGSRGFRVVRDWGEMQALPRGGENLVQELLPGTEYSLDVLAASDGVVRAVVPRARLKVDSGIAITGRTVIDTELERLGALAFERMNLSGVANVQVKRDADGTAKLIEINPRFPGTMPLTVASGVNMPVLALREALGEPMPPGPLPFEEIAMARHFTERFFPVAELDALEVSADTGAHG